MKHILIAIFFISIELNTIGQVIIGPKGTKITIDSSKWKLQGNDMYNKNIGKIGIGTSTPSAQLHTTSDVRFEGIGTNTSNSKILTSDALGNVTTRNFSNFLSSNIITNAMLAQVSSPTFKGRISAGNGNVEDLSPAQATAILDTFSSNLKGLVPASGGGTTTYLRADGVFASPPGNGNRRYVILSSDVINNNAAANTLQDVTGLSFNVTAGVTYRFYAMIPYTSQQTNNGSRWTINTPSTTFIGYVSRCVDNPEFINYCDAANLPLGCSNLSKLTGNIAIIQGVVTPSVNGIVQVKFASATSGKSITAKAGATLEYW